MVSARNSEHSLIAGPVGKLEVVLHGGEDTAAHVAIVCHPHPQHGGTMDNKVVTTLIRAFGELQLPAVRFNFRGTGQSEGAYDDGRGEVDDLAAVVAWMAERYPAARPVLAGFSFGAGVAGNGAQRLAGVAHLVLVAPPVGRYGFSERRSFPCPWTLVMGGRDELVAPDMVNRWADTLSPVPEILAMPEASHFFHGHLVQMREGLVEILRDRLREG
ncbi:MAG: alpha/beta fold hydrolase [Porticoccaceae bacterium]